MVCPESSYRNFVEISEEKAIDTYDHIDSIELKESYMAYIPKLGI